MQLGNLYFFYLLCEIESPNDHLVRHPLKPPLEKLAVSKIVANLTYLFVESDVGTNKVQIIDFFCSKFSN